MINEIPVLYTDKSECCGCTACCSVCPADAITMKPDAEGFLYPEINAEKCIRCRQCIQVCPFRKAESQD